MPMTNENKIKIEVGKFYRGKMNNCLIQIMAFKEQIGVNDESYTIAYYMNMKNGKIDSAPLSRLEHSSFEEVDVNKIKESEKF